MNKCMVHCVKPETGYCVSCDLRVSEPEKRTWREWFYGLPKIYNLVYTPEALELMPKIEDLSPEMQAKIRWIESL